MAKKSLFTGFGFRENARLSGIEEARSLMGLGSSGTEEAANKNQDKLTALQDLIGSQAYYVPQNLDHARKILKVALMTPGPKGNWGIPINLVSDPGEGKTASVNQVAKELGFILVTIIAGLREPGDFLGIPAVIEAPDRKGEYRTIYGALDWATEISGKHAIIFLDDVSTASKATQNALLRVIDERVVGQTWLGPYVRFVLATNPGIGATLPPPVVNRMATLPWPPADSGAWARWVKRYSLSPWSKFINDAKQSLYDPNDSLSRIKQLAKIKEQILNIPDPSKAPSLAGLGTIEGDVCGNVRDTADNKEKFKKYGICPPAGTALANELQEPTEVEKIILSNFTEYYNEAMDTFVNYIIEKGAGSGGMRASNEIKETITPRFVDKIRPFPTPRSAEMGLAAYAASMMFGLDKVKGKKTENIMTERVIGSVAQLALIESILGKEFAIDFAAYLSTHTGIKLTPNKNDWIRLLSDADLGDKIALEYTSDNNESFVLLKKDPANDKAFRPLSDKSKIPHPIWHRTFDKTDAAYREYRETVGQKPVTTTTSKRADGREDTYATKAAIESPEFSLTPPVISSENRVIVDVITYKWGSVFLSIDKMLEALFQPEDSTYYINLSAAEKEALQLSNIPFPSVDAILVSDPKSIEWSKKNAIRIKNAILVLKQLQIGIPSVDEKGLITTSDEKVWSGTLPPDGAVINKDKKIVRVADLKVLPDLGASYINLLESLLDSAGIKIKSASSSEYGEATEMIQMQEGGTLYQYLSGVPANRRVRSNKSKRR